jgi:hypothetical protein
MYAFIDLVLKFCALAMYLSVYVALNYSTLKAVVNLYVIQNIELSSCYTVWDKWKETLSTQSLA